MGKRGPPRQPIKTLLDKGSWRGTARALTEVQGTNGTPAPMAFIQNNPDALEIYDILMQEIGALGVLKTQDGMMLSICAQYLAKANYADSRVPLGGDVVDTSQGPRLNPWCRRADDCRAEATKIMVAYGMTASARVGLTTQAVAAVSGAAKLAARFNNAKKT